MLNNPEHNISNKIYDSIKLLEWGLTQLESNFEDYEKYDVNLLSFMTLDIEHLHSTVNYKQGFQTLLKCRRSFASSIKENLRYLTQWSRYYFTYYSKDSCYPSPENVIHFKDIRMPAPLSPARMTSENKETMRERESVTGKAVRQGLYVKKQP